MFEQLLTTHCAPTLAGIKSASLFSCRLSVCEAKQLVSLWDTALTPFGLRLHLLIVKNGRALLYLYRPKRLMQELMQTEIQSFLSQYGYPADFIKALHHLSKRIWQEAGFPHEIGVFLGYPLEDVLGFIEHDGKNFCLCGYWKVYGDAEKAQALFNRYAACTKTYTRLFQKGRCVAQLAVAC